MAENMNAPMYLHGLEGKPWGTKGAWMTESFGATAPEMPAQMGDPEAFNKSVDVATRAVLTDQPSVIVGSSFGGAVLLKLIVDGTWRGPSIFLAQAGVKYGIAEAIPAGVPAILIHARDDQIVPFEDSELIVNNSDEQVELWPTGGDHRLHHIIEDGTLGRAVNQMLSRT